jgi:hypothetical protein
VEEHIVWFAFCTQLMLTLAPPDGGVSLRPALKPFTLNYSLLKKTCIWRRKPWCFYQ